MHKILNRLFLALLLLSLGACTSTRFVSTWKDPNTTFGQLDGQKIAAFFINENEASRRVVEDTLAEELTTRGARGVPGYTLLSDQSAQDEEVAGKELREAGVDAVVTLRIVSEDTHTTTTPGQWYRVPAYRSWGGYWYPSWKTVYEPGYTQEQTILKVETLIYRLDSGELIWAGVSNTTNPGALQSFVHDLAKATDDAIQKSQLMR